MFVCSLDCCGRRRHFDLQAKELRSKGVHLESDNRCPIQMCVCDCIVTNINGHVGGSGGIPCVDNMCWGSFNDIHLCDGSL